MERRENGAWNTIISFKVMPPMTRRPSIRPPPLTASELLPNRTFWETSRHSMHRSLGNIYSTIPASFALGAHMIHSSQWTVSGSVGYYLPRWPILLCSSVFFPLHSLPAYQCSHHGSHVLKMARQYGKDLVFWCLFGQQPPR